MSIEEITKFEEIYEKYWKLAYSIALKVLRNEADAEDVVQQTFLYLFCHLEKVGDVDSPSTKAYIAKTAEHRAIDIIRAKQRFVSLDNYPDFTAPHTDALHPLEDALSQLPERYRQLLVLHYTRLSQAGNKSGRRMCSAIRSASPLRPGKLPRRRQTG